MTHPYTYICTYALLFFLTQCPHPYKTIESFYTYIHKGQSRLSPQPSFARSKIAPVLQNRRPLNVNHWVIRMYRYIGDTGRTGSDRVAISPQQIQMICHCQTDIWAPLVSIIFLFLFNLSDFESRIASQKIPMMNAWPGWLVNDFRLTKNVNTIRSYYQWHTYVCIFDIVAVCNWQLI